MHLDCDELWSVLYFDYQKETILINDIGIKITIVQCISLKYVYINILFENIKAVGWLRYSLKSLIDEDSCFDKLSCVLLTFVQKNIVRLRVLMYIDYTITMEVTDTDPIGRLTKPSPKCCLHFETLVPILLLS